MKSSNVTLEMLLTLARYRQDREELSDWGNGEGNRFEMVTWSRPGVDCKVRLIGKPISVMQSLALRISRDSEDQFIDHPNRADSATFVIAGSHISTHSMNALLAWRNQVTCSPPLASR